MADALTPDATTKQSTVGSLLTGAESKVMSFFGGSSTSTASSVASGSSSSASSLLTSPILWISVVVAGVVVYFAKFKKTGRKAVTFRKR